MPAPVRPAPIPTAFRRSSAYSLPDWREKPNSRSCVSPSQTESGSRTSAESATRSAQDERAERLRQWIEDRGERLPRRRQRDDGQERHSDRDVGENRAVARIVVTAGDVRHGGLCSNDRLICR
jgi:hypothetical protein